MISLLFKLKPKLFLSSIISLSTKLVSNLNYIVRNLLLKQVMPAKNNKALNITTTIKDLNQPKYSMELFFPNHMTHTISNSSNNILPDINVIDNNNNIFGLFFHIQNFFTFSTPKILLLIKIKILHYLVLM